MQRNRRPLYFFPPRCFRASLFRRLGLLILFVLLTFGVQAQSIAAEPDSQLGNSRPWSAGVFTAGGFALGYRDVLRLVPPGEPGQELTASIEMQIFSAGFRASKVVTRACGPKLLRGELELGAELLPYWQAHYPRQALTYYFNNGPGRPEGYGRTAPLAEQNRFGIGFTPFLLRWDFSSERRVVPWAQLGGGLLWTNHKFPQYPIRTDNTSVINFTPQAGIGANIFVRPRQSLFFAADAVHISNASLGDHNPGVNVTLQFRVGYSWWRK
jgi:lipid A 3-O-deacylase